MLSQQISRSKRRREKNPLQKGPHCPTFSPHSPSFQFIFCHPPNSQTVARFWPHQLVLGQNRAVWLCCSIIIGKQKGRRIEEEEEEEERRGDYELFMKGMKAQAAFSLSLSLSLSLPSSSSSSHLSSLMPRTKKRGSLSCSFFPGARLFFCMQRGGKGRRNLIVIRLCLWRQKDG